MGALTMEGAVVRSLLRACGRGVEERSRRSVHCAGGALLRFYESNPKGEYLDPSSERRLAKEQLRNLFGARDGFKDLRHQIVRWKDEWKQRLTDDSHCFVVHGDETRVWTFERPESLQEWTCVSDNDHNEGFSRCSLGRSATGKALFQGFVSTRVPLDGKMKRAGYCSMKCHRVTKSFHRETHHNWEEYTHLVGRVRGDGRSYLINISTAGQFDITWNDVYHYVLYTRGGPHWQLLKIPWSKFVFGSKGRVQDMQNRLPLNRVASVGFSVGQIDGPFSLEVDWVGVERDERNPEEFAYEMYRVPPFVARV